MKASLPSRPCSQESRFLYRKDLRGPSLLGAAFKTLEGLAVRPGNSEAGNRYQMAQTDFFLLLEMAIETQR